jgi:hypothetical protein
MRFVPIYLYPVAIHVVEIECQLYTVIGIALQRHPGVQHAFCSHGQRLPRWVKKGDMVKPGIVRRRRGAAFAVPCVQANVVVVSTPRQERGLIPMALDQIHPHHIAPKGNGTIQIGNFQMRVPDAGLGHCIHSILGFLVHHISLSAGSIAI